MGKKIKSNLSIIDRDLKIEGPISSRGKLIIKGQITGSIEGDEVIIAEEGRVSSSSTKVASITIGGKFQGEISASRELVILKTGNCTGKVECKDLIVENGGVLNAEVTCKTAGNAPEKEGNPTPLPGIMPGKQIEL